MYPVSKSRQSILQLPSQLANQIAAGEVVERPASVVKELLENALDAGATQIDIDIQAGGTQLIRIRDNGSGIPQNELLLALSPHATSKIQTIDDLIHITSMGFRGEALASIASVSELVLTSYFKDMAWSIKAKEGHFDLTPASHPQGTTVEVNNLFYNTPARRKFLKAERTEYRHVEDVVKRIALARFDVAFNFRNEQRQVFSLPAAISHENKIQRLTRLINKDFIHAAVELNFENAGLKLSGWLAKGDYSRSQSDMQYFFVNGRMIRDKVITHAVRQAFQDSLYPGRFPVYVLQLEMDPEQVDVNVHPTKHEVRFRQARLIHDFLFHSLRQALSQHNENVISHNGTPLNSFPSSQRYNEYSSKNLHGSLSVAENAPVHSSFPVYSQFNTEHLSRPLGIALTKIKNDYLLAQNEQGILILQLPQARRFLIQQKISGDLAEKENLVSMPVLIPFSVNLMVNAQTWLDKNTTRLRQFGFEFAALGEKQVMVRQVPALLQVKDIKQSIHDFIHVVSSKNSDDTSLFTSVLIDILLQEDFSQQADEWNNLLRQLEQYDLQLIETFYHQLSDKDLSHWFKS